MISLASAAAHADVVSDWAELQTALDKAADDPTAPFDLGMFQAFSKTTLAMFEAANSVDPKYVSWLNVACAPAGSSQVATVSVAAQAASNRAKHGLTKNERESLRAEAVRAARLLDGVKRESKS